MVFRYASPEAVAQQWITDVVGIPTGDQLPTDNTTWAASGYIVATDSGGNSNMYYPLHGSVFTFQAWTNDPESPFPPWNKARNLVETIRNETYQHLGRDLTLPYCDQNARVLQTRVVGWPHKVYGDLGNYAAYTIDVLLSWAPLPKP